MVSHCVHHAVTYPTATELRQSVADCCWMVQPLLHVLDLIRFNQSLSRLGIPDPVTLFETLLLKMSLRFVSF